MTTNVARVAYADESAVTLATGKRVYVLAATILDAGADPDDVRARMRELYTARRRRGEPSHPAKLHWYDEGERHRERICTVVCALPAVTHVAVCLNSAPRRDERSSALPGAASAGVAAARRGDVDPRAPRRGLEQS